MPKNYQFGNSSKEKMSCMVKLLLQPYKSYKFKAHWLKNRLQLSISNKFQIQMHKPTIESRRYQIPTHQRPNMLPTASSRIERPRCFIIPLIYLYALREEINNQHRVATRQKCMLSRANSMYTVH